MSRTVSQTINLQAVPEAVSKYITRIDGGGISIHDTQRQNLDYLQLTSNGIDIKQNDVSIAEFGANSSRIGSENSARLMLEPTMMSLISDENVNFFSVDSDIGTMTGNIKAGDKKTGFNSVTLTLNEVPSNLAINFRCNCSYHVYFAEGTSHVYNYEKRVNSNCINVAYPVVKKSGKDWSVSFNTHIGPIYYGTPLTTNTTKAYTFLKVDGNSEALQSYVYLDYDGAHSLTITLAVSRKSPVSAVDNKMIETTEPTYVGTIHGPAYSIGTREGVANLYSTIIGRSLETSAQDQLVIGKYNTSDGTEGCAFVIGNGTSSNTVSNALTVDWSGNVDIASGAKYKINGSSLAPSDIGIHMSTSAPTSSDGNDGDIWIVYSAN